MNALTEIFNKHLTLKEPEFSIDYSQYTDIQQAAIRQTLTLCNRLPESLDDLNFFLRGRTYILGGFEATELDAYAFAKISKFLDNVNFDFVSKYLNLVRWADQIQFLVGAQVFTFDKDANYPLEKVVLKPKKLSLDGKGKENKPDSAGSAVNAPPTAPPSAGSSAGSDAPASAGAPNEGKKPKKEKKQKPAPAPAAPLTPSVVDFRVGFIQKAEKHPDADSLYVSTIDLGESEPRTICSGLVKFVPIEQMQQRFVVVVANLKPVKMRGIVSNGMVLCDSNAEEGIVEPILVPENSKPGEKIFFEGFTEEAEGILNPKKKQWDQIQPDFTTNDNLEVVYRHEGKEHRLVNARNEVFHAATLKNAVVS